MIESDISMSENKKDFLTAIRSGVLLSDGAMGSMLYHKGIFVNRCFDELNLREPNLVKSVHGEYIKAGSNVIETNTFGASALKLAEYGLEDKVYQINNAATRLARSAADGFSSFLPLIFPCPFFYSNT